MADPRQTSGLLNCGHTPIVFGYGSNQYASHGRPVWRSGKMPAQATAKSVMASAKRLMEVRHFWFSKNRMAEIKVPAWPIPIHQTKLTIAKPQPTGILMPQIPTPLVINQARATVRIITKLNEMANPATQPRDVGRVRTIELILSVTEVKVCPGPSTGDRRRI